MAATNTRPLPELEGLPAKVAVCLAKNTTNPQGLPGDWPMRMEDRARMPGNLPAGWVEMTREAYRAHLQANVAAFEAWELAAAPNRDLEAEETAAGAS